MFSAKLVFFLACAVVLTTALQQAKKSRGAITPLRGNDLKKATALLRRSLAQISVDDGPDYKISKVISATFQVVSGYLYKYNANLINEDNKVKNCKVEIWSQEWLPQGTQVILKCQGEKKVVSYY